MADETRHIQRTTNEPTALIEHDAGSVSDLAEPRGEEVRGGFLGGLMKKVTKTVGTAVPS